MTKPTTYYQKRCAHDDDICHKQQTKFLCSLHLDLSAYRGIQVQAVFWQCSTQENNQQQNSETKVSIVSVKR